MTTPPDLPAGAPADPAGLMHEQTFNEALAQALRQRRQLWRTDPNSVLAERLRTLADAHPGTPRHPGRPARHLPRHHRS